MKLRYVFLWRVFAHTQHGRGPLNFKFSLAKLCKLILYRLYFYQYNLITIRICGQVIIQSGLSVCVSVCQSVQAIIFKLLNLGTSFLLYRCILTKSRSCLSIKVIGSRSRSNEKLTYFYITVASVCLYATKIYSQGQCHLKVKVKVTQYQGQMKGNKISVY